MEAGRNESSQPIGGLLRSFYEVYGMPGEGPPTDFDLSLLDAFPVGQEDQDVLRQALDDIGLRRNYAECRDLVEEVANHMTGEALLRELTECGPLPEEQFEHLVSGVLWFSLVSSLDRRDHDRLPVSPFAGVDLPLHVRIRLTVHGSLVLRLYLALVYIREGDLRSVLEAAARVRKPVASRLLKLLRCDFVRHIRNSLAHGTVRPTIAGLRFLDEGATIVATPAFLNHLATWLCMAELQAASAAARSASA